MLNLLQRLPLPHRLSEQHGHQPSVRPREKMPTIYRHKITQLASLNEAASRHYRETGRTHHLKDLSMTIDRAEMLLKTGMTSRDNPEWIGHTSNHYRQKTPYKSRILSNTYDVLNNPKQIVSGRNEDYYYSRMATSSIVPKEEMRRSTLNWTISQQREVTDKVGSLDRRDYTIPRPLLKIGREGSFVDTYTSF